VITQHTAQPGVQEVGRRVVAPRRLATLGVDRRHHALARVHLAVQASSVSVESAGDALGVVHLEASALTHDDADVTDLAPRLGVEGCRVQEQLALAVLTGEDADHGRLE
jgi:hypothetical protein